MGFVIYDTGTYSLATAGSNEYTFGSGMRAVGHIDKVVVYVGTVAGSVDITVETTESDAQTVLSLPNSTASVNGHYYPRTPTQTANATAISTTFTRFMTPDSVKVTFNGAADDIVRTRIFLEED